jgi:hypothetical protein
MKRNITLSMALIATMILSGSTLAQKLNTLTAKEKKDGFVLLFNGKDFNGWRQCNGKEMPKNWTIDEDAMKVFTAADKKPGQGSNGDIIYAVKKFKNFELSVDWKTSVISVRDGKVTHTQNGVKVVEYTLWTPEWDALVANSKFKTFKGFIEGISKEGYIGLQDHGYDIWFRNIKIREM